MVLAICRRRVYVKKPFGRISRLHRTLRLESDERRAARTRSGRAISPKRCCCAMSTTTGCTISCKAWSGNFPAARRGVVKLRCAIGKGGLKISLADHLDKSDRPDRAYVGAVRVYAARQRRYDRLHDYVRHEGGHSPARDRGSRRSRSRVCRLTRHMGSVICTFRRRRCRATRRVVSSSRFR